MDPGPSTSASVQLDLRNTDSSIAELGTRPDITDTRTLVEAFNRSTDRLERKEFRKWLSAYGDYLNERVTITDEESQFLHELFEITPSDDEDNAVVSKLFFSVHKHVITEVECSVNLMKSLDFALNKITLPIVADRYDRLQSLIDNLLKKLAAASFTRATFETYGMMLFVLYRTVVFLQNVPQVLTSSKRQEIKSLLTKIEEKQEYYPIAYYARLIKIGINKLESGSLFVTMISVGHCAFYMTLGALNFSQAIIAAAHLNLDVSAFEAGIENLRKAFPDFFDNWRNKSLDYRLELIFQATAATVKTKEFKHFKSCFDEVMKRLDKARFKRLNWKMTRFCIVTQLRWLALNGPSAIVRNDALEQLVTWGNRCCIDNPRYYESRHVFQALLEALYAVHKNRDDRDKTSNVLRKMASTTELRFEPIVNEWLEFKSVEDKLLEASPSNLEVPDFLYIEVRKKIGFVLTHEDIQINLRQLKDTYQSSEFVEVSDYSLKFR